MDCSYTPAEVKEKQEVSAQTGTMAENPSDVFAPGCSFYKLACLFFLGAFLGDIVETIFCYFTMGKWMSRSSVVFGPFSIVWGLGCALLTALLYRWRDSGNGFIFLFGTVMGGIYEYLCSVFTEKLFGTIFWDYSSLPLNLGGRINLTYCFFWGIAAILWLKVLYPPVSRRIERIPKEKGLLVTRFMIVFMVFNILVSSLALNRYTQRTVNGAPAVTSLDHILDKQFPDAKMKAIYPKAKAVIQQNQP